MSAQNLDSLDQIYTVLFK